MKNYILGYGSLIEKESRLRTTPNATAAFPVRAKGFKRGWFARTGGVGFSTTYLGCIADAASYVNGVIYEVSESDLKATDNREQGYVRKEVNYQDVEDLSCQLEGESEFKIWIYTNNFTEVPASALPSKEFPIVQSYVDICINGCLEIENLFPKAKGFAIDFIRITSDWSKFWANDRIYPRRPFIYRPNASVIDGLLQANLPDKSIFDAIYIE